MTSTRITAPCRTPVKSLPALIGPTPVTAATGSHPTVSPHRRYRPCPCPCPDPRTRTHPRRRRVSTARLGVVLEEPPPWYPLLGELRPGVAVLFPVDPRDALLEYPEPFQPRGQTRRDEDEERSTGGLDDVVERPTGPNSVGGLSTMPSDAVDCACSRPTPVGGRPI